MKLSYLNRETTSAIKGIALLFMFTQHFFCFPDWYAGVIFYPQLSAVAQYFVEPFRLCIAIFVFFTSFFYFYTPKKTTAYAATKITDILISYWLVYIPFLCFAVLSNCYEFRLADFLYELLGLKLPIMFFCWYVPFYCTVMVLLPLLSRISQRHLILELLLWYLVPVIGCTILKAFFIQDHWQEYLSNIIFWFPCVASGYLFAKYNIFQCFDKFTDRIPGHLLKVLLYLFMVLGAFLIRNMGNYLTIGFVAGDNHQTLYYSLDFLYAPVFIYGAAKILQYCKNWFICRILTAIGKQTLFMWFLHCIFFNVCKEKTQWILYYPKNPILVLLLGLTLCYVGARLLSPVSNYLCGQKKKLLDAVTQAFRK